ncbi:MAG: leucine-rich repeat domain-containing protein, partial [Ignavibacteria bacterium]|nr:leucine-rich repeat domain-containing protein [Ignavibacteria bacterium]
MKYIFAVYFFLLVFVANAQMQTERQYYYRYQIAYENRIIILDDDFLAFFNDIYEIIPSDLRVHITEVQLPPDVNVIDNGISTTDTTTTWSDLFNHFPRIQQVVVTINGNPPIVIPAPGTPSSNTPYLFNSRNSTLTVELSNIGEVPAYIGALTNSIVIADTQDSFVQYLSTHNNILDLFTFLPNLVFLQMPNIIEIPATDNVNIFGQSATNPNTSLTTIVAAKLTIIGASTFANCIVLRNLSLPQARKIGSNAFSNDVNLSPTNRFGNLQIVGEDAFSNTPLATVYPANETVEYSISIGNFSNGSISFIATSLSGDADKTNEYSEVKFTITPAQHYYLQTLDVTIAGLSYTAYSPALTLTFQQYTIPASDVSGDIIIAATFEKVDYTCTFAQTENGTIAVDYGGIIVSGDNVQYNTNDLVLTLSPNSHYQF